MEHNVSGTGLPQGDDQRRPETRPAQPVTPIVPPASSSTRTPAAPPRPAPQPSSAPTLPPELPPRPPRTSRPEPTDAPEIDEDGDDRAKRNPGAIRAEDTEPYLALQYVARLFKIAAMVVVVALVAEIVAGVALEGAGALLPLMAEVIRGIVLAAILWGAGDLTVLLIDVGHDVRAARVLLGRISARATADAAANSEVD